MRKRFSTPRWPKSTLSGLIAGLCGREIGACSAGYPELVERAVPALVGGECGRHAEEEGTVRVNVQSLRAEFASAGVAKRKLRF